MIAKFILCGTISDLKKHEGGIDNKGFYTATITTKSTFEDKEREAFHKVTFFSSFLFDKLSKIGNKSFVTVEGKLSTRKNEEKGFWEPSLNGTGIEAMFSQPKAAEAEKIKDDDDGIPY